VDSDIQTQDIQLLDILSPLNADITIADAESFEYFKISRPSEKELTRI